MESVVSIPLLKAAVDAVYTDLELNADVSGGSPRARRQISKMFRQSTTQIQEPNDPSFLSAAIPKSAGSLNCGQSLQMSILNAPKMDPNPRAVARTPGKLSISDLMYGERRQASPTAMAGASPDFEHVSPDISGPLAEPLVEPVMIPVETPAEADPLAAEEHM